MACLHSHPFLLIGESHQPSLRVPYERPEVSRDVYCERVNRLCYGFTGRDLCRINPPLYGRAAAVAAASGSKITRPTYRGDNHFFFILFYFLLLRHVFTVKPQQRERERIEEEE